MTARTYETLLERAAVALAHGESVVLDASWTDPRWRAAARQVADETWSDVVELRCVAPAAATAERLCRRIGTDDPSDATPEVALAMADALQAWPEATTIDTAGAPADAVLRAMSLVGPRR